MMQKWVRLGALLLVLGFLSACGAAETEDGGDAETVSTTGAASDASETTTTTTTTTTDTGGEDAGGNDSPDTPIRIGFLAPLTGNLAASGEDSLQGFELLWEQVGMEAGGRPIEIVIGDSACNPDSGITQARRLIEQENVDIILGPLCGHVGPAVAQVSAETGVPVVITTAGADAITQVDRVPTVVRPGASSSHYGHAVGDYLYNETSCRRVTGIAADYTHGHENMLGLLKVYEDAGGEVLDVLWTPIGTTDFGPLFGGISDETDCVVVTLVGADRIRIFEQWFDFGYDERFDIFGSWWLASDILSELDDRAIGLYGNQGTWAEGLDRPEAQEFVDSFAERYGRAPASFANDAYTAALFAKTAIDAVEGNVEDTDALMEAFHQIEVSAPGGEVRIDEYGAGIVDVHISTIQEVDHPILGTILMNVPVKTYEGITQFWTWEPDEFLARGGYSR